ncbi:hypothetical protein FDG95_gp379 [Pectobacterium phage vB_PcaM_CBB]|uniref:Uncharacterized protein n=1 Tax=Pectobacterium phage vB_PcaM_CBB TaxID=2772511 RepID=A0A1L2CUB0_9CAUD|nr:hypothetical protein FDG95_gp047 [Pectobacterium phage vB_PcaM_CBB]YP_009595140.1 hypothetical protein FDG95_gp379 [Pectobacterium phage vB_PcaM_CBB]AMM43612.1 hypothetical protein CBB_600 [Pectobacterium phage vB_PcaM_CBB]AMM44163.1 hypothetical protein CBB_47 [Pectobacterium phage vB_PcaM_CBB]
MISVGSSELEALKIRWYQLAIDGKPVIGEDKKLFDSLNCYVQDELKKAYLLGVGDEQETWMIPQNQSSTNKVSQKQ